MEGKKKRRRRRKKVTSRSTKELVLKNLVKGLHFPLGGLGAVHILRKHLEGGGGSKISQNVLIYSTKTAYEGGWGQKSRNKTF